jgi:uncharacterized protein (TIGR00645 family)
MTKSSKKKSFRYQLEYILEYAMFASRWFMAPVYVILSITLGIIMLKVIQEFLHELPNFFFMDITKLLMFVLHIVDMALIGNLVLMIIFAGYENFVSKIDVARGSDDKPEWMGKVDFSGLKLKLVASIVAISGINLLEAFMNVSIYTESEIKLMIAIHLVFVMSGVLLAIMDFIAHKSKSQIL